MLRRSYVEVIAINIIPSTLRTEWPLRNIDIDFSNGNRSSPWYVDLFFPLSRQDFYSTSLWVTWRLAYKIQVLLTISEYLGSSVFLVRSMLLISLVFCVVFFVKLTSFCVYCQMLSIYLDFTFLIATSVFSNVYGDIEKEAKGFSGVRIAGSLVLLCSVL